MEPTLSCNPTADSFQQRSRRRRGWMCEENSNVMSIAKTPTASRILRNSMIDAGKMYLKDVPVLVDVSVVDNWYEK